MEYKLIYEVTDSKCRSKDDIIKLKNNDCEINVKNNPITKSNIVNHLFFIFINIAKSSLIKPITTETSSHGYKNVSFNEAFIKKIESKVLLDIINNYKDDTSAGLDKVFVKILKNLIVDPLVYIYIYNLSIEQGIFPDKLKIADM